MSAASVGARVHNGEVKTARPEADVTTSSSTATQRPWQTVVWDDPVTPMSVVEVIFQTVLGYPKARCTQLMLQVHHEGRAIVWSGQHDRAQFFCAKLQSAGLLSTIEQAGE